MRPDRTTTRRELAQPDYLGPLQDYYVLEPNPCPYLPGRMERKLLTEIQGPQAEEVYDHLTLAGFRRSHRFAYRPACDNCNACVPVRVVADHFRAGKSLRRIMRCNEDLTARMLPPEATHEQYDLFRRYIQSRHGEGEMAGMSEEEYLSMVESSDVDTRLVEYRTPEGVLVAVCLLDWLADGPSAVYSFFDPNEARRSLGTYVVLWLIEVALNADARHVYLGYWIDQSRKMAYKARFRPLERFTSDGWQRLLD